MLMTGGVLAQLLEEWSQRVQFRAKAGPVTGFQLLHSAVVVAQRLPPDRPRGRRARFWLAPPVGRLCRFHRTLSRNLCRTDAEHPHRRSDRRRSSMSPCGSESFRTRVLSRANSPPAAWSAAAHRAISKSTARHGHPTISQPTIASRWLRLDYPTTACGV